MNSTLLIFNLPPELEEDMVDYLLSKDSVGGFTSYAVNGHGEHDNLSVAEQVSGRRRRMQFEVILPWTSVDCLIGGLAQDVGRDIRYWQIPVTQVGRV